MINHKIIIENIELEICENTILEIKKGHIFTINIKKPVNLYIFNDNKLDYKINFNVFVNTNIYHYCDETLSNSEVLINPQGEIKIDYIGAIISVGATKQVIKTIHKNSHTCCDLKIRGLSLNDSNLQLDLSSYIEKDCLNTKVNQNIHVINVENGESNISPNLYIDCDQVEVSHAAYIGTFSEQEVFYLKTRGFNGKEAFNLLLKGFILGDNLLDIRVKDKLLQIVNKYRR